MQANPFAALSHKENLSHAYLVRGDFASSKEAFAANLRKVNINIDAPGHYIFYGGTFAVDNARDLVAWYHSGRTSNDDSFTVAILAPQVLKKDAQQMLLKIFEESRHPYIFFIFAPGGTEIIDTILSRVQIINIDQEESDIGAKFIKLSISERIKKVAGDIKNMEGPEVRAYTEDLVRNLITYLHSQGMEKNKETISRLMQAQNSLADSHTAPKFILDYIVTII